MRFEVDGKEKAWVELWMNPNDFQVLRHIVSEFEHCGSIHLEKDPKVRYDEGRNDARQDEILHGMGDAVEVDI